MYGALDSMQDEVLAAIESAAKENGALAAQEQARLGKTRATYR